MAAEQPGWREGDGAGNEEDFVAGGVGGLGEGVAHATGRAVGEEPHGVDGLARGAGGDEEAHGGSGGGRTKRTAEFVMGRWVDVAGCVNPD